MTRGRGRPPRKFRASFGQQPSYRGGGGTPRNMAALSAWFWNERFWLPHNVTWADLADPAPGVEYPKAGHLLTVLPLALGIFAVRMLFERFVLTSRLCLSCGKVPTRGFFRRRLPSCLSFLSFSFFLSFLCLARRKRLEVEMLSGTGGHCCVVQKRVLVDDPIRR